MKGLKFDNSVKAKCWSKRNDIQPCDIALKSCKKFWFNCDKCEHEIITSPVKIAEGKWCGYCSSPVKYLCSDTNCKWCFNNSFASDPKAQFWSKKNDKLPRNCSSASAEKYWFDCNECGHSFKSGLNKVKHNRWCKFCGNNKLCEDDSCKICFEKSFASHPRANCWHVDNTCTPRQVTKFSCKIIKFKCSECNHVFSASVSNIRSENWCNICAHKKLCNDECKLCYKNSFASHPKSIYWSNKNVEKPRNVFLNSGRKFWFNCNKCSNEFEMGLNSINMGRWCPNCKYKTELKLYDALIQIYNITREFKVDWCKFGTYLPFDFVIKDKQVIIELDGAQHFQQISNWKSPEETRKSDVYKMKCANENGYSVIRILQEDVWFDKIDWLSQLINEIERMYFIEDTEVVYICNNDIYDKHKEDLKLLIG